MRTPPNERLKADIVDADTSSKADKPAGSERRCILSGETHPREALVRLAISPAKEDGSCDVLPDPGAKAPGRGAWIAPDAQALEKAIADGQLRGALARAFKGAKLSIPDALPFMVEAALTRHLTDRLGLEMRAGNIVLGSGRIADQARMGAVARLLHARDASEDGRRKLDQAWRVGMDAEGSGARGDVLPLDRATLSVALGRENVVHLGVAGHSGDLRAAKRVEQAVSRLVKFVEGNPAEVDQNGSAKTDSRPGPDSGSDRASAPAACENT
ncbi:MAG: DUF448 domain-containing protein [Pseudomonadota bacterium]